MAWDIFVGENMYEQLQKQVMRRKKERCEIRELKKSVSELLKTLN